MAKRDPWAAVNPKMAAAVAGLHRKDEQLRDTKQRGREGGDVAMLPLEEIQPRPHGDARPITDSHVLELAESISVVGLLQPITVDRKSRLVCGGHRLHAIRYLREHMPEAFARRFPDGQVPARVLSDLDAQTEAGAARAAELEENEKRKNFTKEEVLGLAKVLKKGGYRFTVGRPKPGEIPLAPTLATATGLNLRTVRRYLAQAKGGGSTTSESPIFLASLRLRRAAEGFIYAVAKTSSPSTRKVVQELDHIMAKIAELHG